MSTDPVGAQGTVTSVVLTGAWAGGEIEFDVWPQARPAAGFSLMWSRDSGGIEVGVSVSGIDGHYLEKRLLRLGVVSPHQIMITQVVPQARGAWRELQRAVV